MDICKNLQCKFKLIIKLEIISSNENYKHIASPVEYYITNHCIPEDIAFLK